MNLPPEGLGFCSHCGSPLVERLWEGRPRRVCPACGQVQWRNAKPCAGALILRHGKVLLIRRSIEPFRGYWDIPGGFCEVDEHPAETAIREAREETGLEIELTGLWGLWLDDYAGHTTLNVYYLARPLGQGLRVGSDADGAAWFAPHALPRRIAFANGILALRAWARGDAGPLYLRGVPVAGRSSDPDTSDERNTTHA